MTNNAAQGQNQTAQLPNTEKVDVAIIGGGMVGASLALALVPAAREYGLKIMVCEAQPLPQNLQQNFTPSYDARSTALAYGSRYLFEELGIWERLAEGAEPIRRIQVSDRGHFGSVRLEAEQEQVPALGYVLENRWLGQTLLEAMQNASDVLALKTNAEVIAAVPLTAGMRLEVDLPGAPVFVDAGLVVMADGGRSGLREALGIDYQQQDYDQFAVIANLTLSEPHKNVAYERFTDEGPVALLPLPDDEQGKPRSALVWSLPLEQIDEVMAQADGPFLEAVQACFGYRAGAFLRVGERHCYPLKLARAREMVRPHLVVLGNAAHTLHPIAGQGFNLALRGALGLAENIVDSLQQSQPPGSLVALQRFENRLEWDRDKTIMFSDKLMKLFANPRLEAIMARNLGLLMMEVNPALKHEFSRSAMGLDVPAPQFRI